MFAPHARCGATVDVAEKNYDYLSRRLAAPGIQGCTDYGKILVVIYLLVVIGWLFWANGSVWSIGPPKMNLVSRFLEAGCLK